MTADNPLDALERLAGGEWHYAEGSIEKPPIKYHSYNWGLPGVTVLSGSFSPEGKQVAQALWYWHPGEKVIKALGITHLRRNPARFIFQALR